MIVEKDGNSGSAPCSVLKEEEPMSKQARWWLRGWPKRRSRQPWSFRPQVELLEDRLAPAVITVNTVDDNIAKDKFLTLREAIMLVNGTLPRNKLSDDEKKLVQGNLGRGDTINFDIPNQEKTIKPTAALPAIVRSVTIDGRPPPGKPNQVIVLDGSKAGAKADGLDLKAGASKVSGLTIQNFDNDGIQIIDVGQCTIGGTTAAERCVIVNNNAAGIAIAGSGAITNYVIGCYIGNDGTNRQSNGIGVEIFAKASSNFIGDGNLDHRNIISGNRDIGVFIHGALSNEVNGNYIGTNKTGDAQLGNGIGVEILESSNTLIGGPRDLVKGSLEKPANIISGNSRQGVRIPNEGAGGTPTTGTRIQGNYIGVDKTGTKALGNTREGISDGGKETTIGGDKLETLNVISGNGQAGITVDRARGLKIKFNNIGLGKDRANKTVNLGNTGGAIDLTDATQTVTIKQNMVAYSKTQSGIMDPDEKGKKADPNLIFGNAGLGIDVGPSGVTPGLSPTLTSAVESGGTVRIQGSMQSTPNALFLLEFFGNQVASAADAQGEFFLGSTYVTTDSTGAASFDVTFSAAYGNYVTATYTNAAPDGYTSEFGVVALTGGGTGNAVVGDRVWDDVNQNGIQDPGETGHSGVTVKLFTSAGSLSATTTTASDGSYSFSGVTPGDYYLQFVAPSGYSFSPPYQTGETLDSDADPGSGLTHDFTLSAGEVNPEFDAGLFSTSSAGEQPAPEVTGLSPSTGTTSGGTLVTISGNNFANATEVLFGDEPAEDFTIGSATVIYATAPAQAAGTVDVKVYTPSSVSATTTADQYSYTAASSPTLTSITPNSGSTGGGTVVTLIGTNLRGTTDVLFGTTEAVGIDVIDDNTVEATAPAHASGSVSVTVKTYSGTSGAVTFTYNAAPAPSVTGLDTNTGPTYGGSIVTITGNYFSGASAVKFGSLDANWYEVLSDNAIEASSPAQAAGTIDVTVSTPTGTSSTSSADHFTYTTPSAPTVTGVSPSSGSTAGGTVVTITGTNYTDVTDVTFGGAEVDPSDIVVNSSTQLTVVAPAHIAGVWDVVVSTLAGDSALSSSDRFTYTLASAPSISSLSPTSGTAAGGTIVTISGSNFTGAYAVYFGNTAADFDLVSDTQIVATTPAEATGAVNVSVYTTAGNSAASSSSSYTFTSAGTPTVSSLDTSSGSTAGGTSVLITGTHLLGATAVNFGSTAAASFEVVSDTQIVAVTAPAAAGSVTVSVTTTSGTSSSGPTFTYTAASAPSISALSPSSGSAAGGDTIVITGSHFLGTSAVSFGGTAAWDFEIISDSSIVATAPAKPSGTGTVDVRVTTTAGTSSIVTADQYTYNWVTAAAPTVTGLDVNTGTTAGGTLVTLSGTNFAAASAVKFGTTNATSFTVLSDTQIQATSPAGSAGTINITVTTPGGTSSTGSANQFTYVAASVPTVTLLSATSGSTAGGTSVSLTGTNFTGATAVNFGSFAATSFTVNSATSITATSPAEPAGIINVTVTTSAGTSTTGSGNQFTYNAASAPTVSSLSPTSGSSAGGTSVTITGTNFTGATAVLFGDYYATFTVNSSTSITATAPAQPAGTVDVIVQSYSGQSAPSSSTRFSYSAATDPAVSSLSPTSGSTAGGTSVVITGTNFTGATDVWFGAVEVPSFTVNSSTQITATSPSQAVGTIDVTVETPSGVSVTSSSDHFTYTAASAPTVTSLSPSSGSTGGGTSVTLTGTNFTGATAVDFGSVAATFTVNSATSITATSPPQASGNVYVTVTTPSGTSSTGAGNQFTYNAAAAPSVSSVTPTSISSAGGDAVTILGSHFLGASAVNFGSVAALDFTVENDSVIVATAPAQAAGTVHITVTTPTGTSSTGSGDQVTYTAVSAPTVTGVSPISGTTAGGTTITITGTNFSLASEVDMAGLASAFSVLSSTTIQLTSPAEAAGTVDVQVFSPGGSSTLSTSSRYTYVAASAPAVSSLSPTSGSTAGGTSVTITGTDFTGATAVTFGDVAAASFTVVSGTSITAVSPSQAAGTVDVRVSTTAGESAAVSGDHFTYTAASAPAISSLSPSSGPATGGTDVTITGSNFTGATAVTIGGTAASFDVNSDTRITATTPPGTAGSANVTVTTPSGTSSAATFTYTSVSAPSVTSVSPSSGSTAGGTVVIVTGTGFTGASQVKFGTVVADTFLLLSDTSMSVVSPAESAGTVDLTVVGPGGTSSTSSADHFTYSAPSAPTVTALSPTSGSSGGGTVVLLTGTNFTGTTAVNFGAVPATSFVINSATTITAVAPAQAAATINVTVTTAAGTSTTGSGNQFTYTAASAPSISSLSPNAGKTVGLIQILINGSHFNGATSVSFGGTAVSFLPVSDTLLIAAVPAHSSGSVSVTVTTPSGTSSGVTFTYSANTAPVASADTYTDGSGGTLVVSAASGVLSNDSDSNGDPLFVSWYSAPSHGTLVMNGDGSFTYVRNTGYSGGDSFSYKASDGLAESSSTPTTIQLGFPEHAAGGAVPRQPGVADLTSDALQPIVDAAIQRYAAAGVDAAGLATLRATPVLVRDLSGDLLGLTIPDGIVLDRDAAGYGWFVDATPDDDVEFSGSGTVLRAVAGTAVGRMDLLTVVTHELGHLLGRPDLDTAAHPSDIMADSLATGMRRLLVESQSTAATPVVERASLPSPLDAGRPIAVAPPQPEPRLLPSRGSDFLLAGLNRLIPTLQPPTFPESDLVRVVGRWGTADEPPPRASQEAEGPRLLTTATPVAATRLEASPIGRGDPSARDWLFAHPQDADALLNCVFPS
jgi:hypothetical protein